MSAVSTILIVEDQPDVADSLRQRLEREGYACVHVTDGELALEAVRRQPPDLILLDRGLPRMNGDEVARRLKADPRSEAIPIIMLTGKAEESDELVGFAVGADDYIAKPFSPKRLIARIEAQLRRRRSSEAAHTEVTATSITLDRSQARVFVDKTAVPLTAVEYKILATLIAAGGRTLQREQLMTMVYGKTPQADPRSFEGQVNELQRKMGPAGGCIQILNEGLYAFCPPRAYRTMA